MKGESLHKLISAMKNNCEDKSIQYKASMNVASELVSKVSNARKENNSLIFERKNIAIYLKENPYDYPLKKVDPKWFVDILTSNFHFYTGPRSFS